MHDNYNPNDIGDPALYSAKLADTSNEYRVMRVGEFVKMQDGYIAVPVENLDPILNNNFETALAALIEHHGADALTALAAVMRHYSLEIDCVYHPANECDVPIICDRGGEEIFRPYIGSGTITANDIKPEK